MIYQSMYAPCQKLKWVAIPDPANWGESLNAGLKPELNSWYDFVFLVVAIFHISGF
jgi:hypothetical protein